MSKTITGYIDYTTREGDTFDTLALAIYHEEKAATDIITANPDYADTLIFDAGVKLKIPVIEKVETPESLPPWRRS